jgi:hypothetical protein
MTVATQTLHNVVDVHLGLRTITMKEASAYMRFFLSKMRVGYQDRSILLLVGLRRLVSWVVGVLAMSSNSITDRVSKLFAACQYGTLPTRK